MNILDHILANHYECDSKGRALVPMSGGRTATICATDAPGERPIVGWFVSDTTGDAITVKWQPDGTDFGFSWITLLPPAPRKIKAACWAIRNSRGDFLRAVDSLPTITAPGDTIVAATIEYEEPWQDERSAPGGA